MNNIFHNIPHELPEELVETLLESRILRIERIVSRGHCSEPEFWYDQDKNEWIILLSGKAEIEFWRSKKIFLGPGDYINIPAHKKHRVNMTDSKQNSVWLAIFY
ncbi:MAG: cupin domain-containing protein [Candidatus Cloacimonadota bacterium]|nr:cupin domain-containing protein [Candidatus Cloacimonadota bacterium]